MRLYIYAENDQGHISFVRHDGLTVAEWLAELRHRQGLPETEPAREERLMGWPTSYATFVGNLGVGHD